MYCKTNCPKSLIAIVESNYIPQFIIKFSEILKKKLSIPNLRRRVMILPILSLAKSVLEEEILNQFLMVLTEALIFPKI